MLYVLGVAITPVVGWFIVSNDRYASQEATFKHCRNMAGDNYVASSECLTEFLDRDPLPFWPVAWEIAQGAMVVGIILWLICFAATRTIYWILAGREK